MNFKSDDEIIEEIIEAFGVFAFGDIEYNVDKKPIAAFMLCSCLIDQLATFIYNEPEERNMVIYKRFIKDYLPHYIPLNLYVNLRCKLVHNYTVGKHIRLTSEEAPYENIALGRNVNVLTAKMMYNELKLVFDKLTIEFRDQSSNIRKNAVGRYKHDNSRIIAKSTIKYTTYLEYEADLLIEHFTKLLKGGINKGQETWEVERIDKKDLGEGRFLAFVVLSSGKKKITPQLDELITALNLETSTSVLNRLDNTQHNNPPSGDIKTSS
jgi:hypothetical protein